MARRLSTALALLAATVAVAACGGEGRDTEHVIREGLSIDLQGLEYNVFITRQLNLRSTSDRAYYNGPEAPPGSAHYGVFIQVCNRGGDTRMPAREFKVIDTRGNEFEPVEADRDNPFAYVPEPLDEDECIPAAGSVAQLGPTAGAMLLFELPQEATENRPLEFEIVAPAIRDGKHETHAVELDI